MDKTSEVADAQQFSLVQGGPLFQLLLRSGLVQPSMGLLARRMVIITSVAWVPLLILAVASGDAFGGSDIPFFSDIGAHVRLLISLPLLIAAEVIVHHRIRATVAQFIERGIVPDDQRPAFDDAVAMAMRMRNSVTAELVVLAIAWLGGQSLANHYLSMQTASWYATPDGQGVSFTAAGYWYAFISLGLLRFIALRWYFRLLVWYVFLWRVASRVRLSLNALHPDRAAGLGFLAGSVFAFQPILLAHTFTISGVLFGKILYEGASLHQFKVEIAVWVVVLVFLMLAPMLCFTMRINAAKRAALREYGIVASHYVTDFHRRWIANARQNDEALLGSADIQSLADLSNSFDVVQETRMVPFDQRTVLRLAFVTILPLLPLTLTVLPVEELIDRAISLFV